MLSSRARKSLSVCIAAVGLTAALVTVAYADTLQDSIEATGSVQLIAGDATSTGTATVRVVANSAAGDPDAGCNFDAAAEHLTVAIVTPPGVSASPSSVTFTTCGTETPITFTASSTATSGTATARITDNTSGGTFVNQIQIPITVTQPPNTPPTVTVAGVTDGASYNKGTVPAATCEVTDAEDGNSSFPATLSAVTGPHAIDGIGAQTASCSYTDGGGLTASASKTYRIVDPTPPVISSALNPLTPDGANGWYTSDVTLTWTVTEPESPSSLVKTGCVDQNITTDQAATTYSCAATSAGGTADPNTVTIKRDATAPTNVQFNADEPADGGRYFPTTVPSGTGCTADDATSGVASCVVTGRSTAVGTHTLTATATDNAGNTATATRTYSVRVLTVSGFFQPVDMGGVLNIVKGGATVPLKFTVFDGGVEQTAISVVKSFTQRTIACGTLAGATDEIEIVTTGGTTLRYDATAHQFIQNWQTPKKPGTCMQATVTMIDGTAITAYFQLK
jgi:hypothetical protein